jgi:hypothetical protein
MHLAAELEAVREQLYQLADKEPRVASALAGATRTLTRCADALHRTETPPAPSARQPHLRVIGGLG